MSRPEKVGPQLETGFYLVEKKNGRKLPKHIGGGRRKRTHGCGGTRRAGAFGRAAKKILTAWKTTQSERSRWALGKTKKEGARKMAVMLSFGFLRRTPWKGGKRWAP